MINTLILKMTNLVIKLLKNKIWKSGLVKKKKIQILKQ